MGGGIKRIGSWVTTSAPETVALGEKIAALLALGSVVAFRGSLAAGKTTLIKGIVHAVTGVKIEEVVSPTFVTLQIYEGQRDIKVYHFDLYRLSGPDEFLSYGFDEYLHTSGVTCLEWSERIAPLLPKTTLVLSLEHLGGDQRSITLQKL